MSGTARCPAGCGRAVLYATTARKKNIPLNPTPDPAGVWIPIAGRAWQKWELIAAGKPDWADAPAHIAHPTTCPLWNAKVVERRHGSAQGHLACMACGTVDATVRHGAELDLCADCRPDQPPAPPDDLLDTARQELLGIVGGDTDTERKLAEFRAGREGHHPEPQETA